MGDWALKIKSNAVGYGIGLEGSIEELAFSGPVIWGRYPFYSSYVEFIPEMEQKPLLSCGPLSYLLNPRRIVVEDKFLFTIDADRLFFAYKSFDQEKLKYYFYQFVLPLFGQCIGKLLFLHGGAFEVNSQAVGLMASSGGGKSTLLAAFQELGYNLVADDRTGFVLETNEPLVVPAHPFLRNYRKSEDIGRPVTLFSKHILPLKTIFFSALDR
ncbi:hypothetical protein IT6_03870 [Methylacidiphilum caldifontis]|uniref:hypothetical protein n=1 Tax=Methylacidiphilum caldifontis TaxID=2795386 RepID=UPI001A8F0990|nr:hypothetical protein [Methylacidiphilum caldifontis]QSR89428.1 hypothetical protein IT6_03870 [Methylacidiphilum caldifontis]